MASPSSSTVTPFAQSFFKSQIFLNNRRLWNATTIRNGTSILLPKRQLTHVLLLLLPPHLHLPPHSLPIRRRFFRSHPPLPPLLRPRQPPLPSPMSSLAHTNSTDSDSTGPKTVRVVVKGRVQGVFYRNWTMENAKELGLTGWVRNRRDGSVEALFSGNPDKVEEMEQRCRRGPPAAMVTGLEVLEEVVHKVLHAINERQRRLMCDRPNSSFHIFRIVSFCCSTYSTGLITRCTCSCHR